MTAFADPAELVIYDPDHSTLEDRFVSIGRPDDEPRDEYDFREGVRGRHKGSLEMEGAVVRLDPNVALRFPTSEAVNAALRSVADEDEGGLASTP